MRIVRLIYASTFTKNTDPSELKKIHDCAVEKNKTSSVTGMLIFGNDFFLQCLEGGREAVNRIYHKIILDSRHTHPLLLEYSEVSEREFETWSMKLVLLTPEKIKLLSRYCVNDVFNPYEMSAASALKLMLSLKN